MIDLEDIKHRATISVPLAGQVVGIGRDAAYRAVQSGDIPSLRVGRRIVVPVPKLLALLGVESPPPTARAPLVPAGL